MSNEQGPNFRKSDIDYANFPVDAAYISRADVVSAYEQGRADAQAEDAERIREMQLSINAMERFISQRSIKAS